MFRSRRRRDQQAEAEPPELPPEWRPFLHRRIAWWGQLPDADRAQLEELTVEFVRRIRWEAARGFAVTDEVRSVIAANACRLLLGFGDELASGVRPFDRVSSIIVHRSTVLLQGEHAAGGDGVMTDGAYALHGQAHLRGPVVLSWQAVTSDLFHPRRGRNVVIHEFAHQLDMLDGAIDGAPPLGDADTRAAWERIRDREHRALSLGRAHPLLDPYGGTNHAEFFAVVTELFFTRPVELRDELSELYDVLVALYRQDPAALTSVP